MTFVCESHDMDGVKAMFKAGATVNVANADGDGEHELLVLMKNSNCKYCKDCRASCLAITKQLLQAGSSPTRSINKAKVRCLCQRVIHSGTISTIISSSTRG